ncbi:MAG: GNAT family N-acetyltransferase [archaeon]|jgi:ribosomal protein S18 acetylase RimI-like enzyme
MLSKKGLSFARIKEKLVGGKLVRRLFHSGIGRLKQEKMLSKDLRDLNFIKIKNSRGEKEAMVCFIVTNNKSWLNLSEGHKTDRLSKKPFMYIDYISVQKNKSTGLGTQLLLEVVTLAKKQGVKNVFLDVKKNSRAFRLYKKFGFVEKGQRNTDFLLMELEI